MGANFLWGKQRRLLRGGDIGGAQNEVRDRATWMTNLKIRQVLTAIRAMMRVNGMAAGELTGPGTC